MNGVYHKGGRNKCDGCAGVNLFPLSLTPATSRSMTPAFTNVGPVSSVKKNADEGTRLETRRFKSGLQRMWAGAKYKLANPESGTAEPAVKERNQWYKCQCYLVERLLASAIATEPKVEVAEVTVTLRSNTLVGDGIVVLALVGMSADKSVGMDTIEEAAGSRRFRLADIRKDVVSVTFRVTDDLSRVIKPEGERSKAPRLLIRCSATKECEEQEAVTLTYKVKVNAIVGGGPTQIVS